jgi:hypothetical protein
MSLYMFPLATHAQPALAQLDPFATTAPVTHSEVPFATAMLYDVRLGRLAHKTMSVYDAGTDLLVPLGEVLQLAGFAYTKESAERIAGRVGRRDTPFKVDAGTGKVTFGSASEVLSPQALCVIHGTLYLSMREVSRLLESDADVDRSEAAVTVMDVDSLPVARRAARAAARAALQAEEARHPSLDGLFRATSASWGGFAFDYTVANTRMLGFTSTDYATSLSTMFAGGMVTARTSGSGMMHTTESAWQRIWPAGQLVTQLRLGDGSMGDAGAGRARGFFITNAPYARPTVVAAVPFDGTLAPGWTVDAYRDGVLVGFDTVGASGQYSITLPVHYGENPFELVATGPFGERTTLARAFRVLPQLLPAHTWEYSADGGHCLSDDCGIGAHGELRYGLASRWSLRTGASAYTWHPDTRLQQERTRPYLGISAVPHNGVSFDAEAIPKANGMLPRVHQATLWVDPSPRISVSLGYDSDIVPDGFGSRLFPFGGNARIRLTEQWTLDSRIAPTDHNPGWEFHVAGATSDVGMRGNGRLAAVFAAKSATLRPYLRVSRDPYEQGSFAGLDVVAIPTFSSKMMSGWWLHVVSEGGFGAYRTGAPFRTVMTNTEFTVARGAARESHTEAGIRFQHNTHGAAFTLRFVRILGGFRSSSAADFAGRTAAGGSGVSRVSHVASGSLRWDDGFIASPEPIVDRAGVAGIVFLDANANGVRDKSEQTLQGVSIRVDGYVVRSTVDGRYEAWGIAPANDAVVSIDTASLESPWWVPARNAVVVRPSSNHAVTLDIPILVAGIAEGTVDMEQTTTTTITAAGSTNQSVAVPVATRVILTHHGTGSRRTTNVYSDGSWYQMGLLPGEYDAQADCGPVATGNLRSNRVRFVVGAGHTTTHVSLSACHFTHFDRGTAQ